MICAVVPTTTASYNNMESVVASATTRNVEITYGNNRFAVSYESDSGNNFSSIFILPSSKDTALTLTYPTFSEALKAIREGGNPEATRWSEKMVLLSASSGKYTSIKIPSSYYEIPQHYIDANETIENVEISTENDITLKTYCFYRCSNLKTISISAPNKTVTIEASAFHELSSLQDVNITAGNIVIKNAFSSCAPENLILNGNLSTDSVLGVNTLNTLSTNGNTVLPKDFVKNCTIQTVSLNGTTTLNENSFSGCTITNLNLEGTTTFGTGSLTSCDISNMSINGPTVFANKTLLSSVVSNLYFNLDNRNGCGNVRYTNGNDRLGSYSTAKNIYFNYADVHGTTGNVQELNEFPLGGDISDESSLNCDNIYFCDADFKYIGGGSSYRRYASGKTNVYGWGGSMAWDTDGNRKAGYDMYQEWIDNNTCTFYNYVKNTNSGRPEDVYELKVSEVYIPDTDTSVSYDFSSTENLIAWATFESQNNQYAEKNEFVRENGYCMKPISMNTAEAATNFATNFNYRILKKDDTVKGLEKDRYNYYYSSNDEAKGWYTALTTATDLLTEGGNHYLIEVGGVKYPFTIQAKYNKIEILTVENDELHLNVGESVTPDMLKVTATYTDGTSAALSDTSYEIVEHSIIEGENIVTIRAKEHNSSDEYISKDIIVKGYSDTCTGFKAVTAIEQLYEGGTLNVSDVILTDVTYKNPTKRDEKITSGFKFLVNGQESDTYTISNGVNSISVVYKGYTLENALLITGIKNTITKVEAIYTGTVYEGMEVSTGPAALAIYIYENDGTERKLLTDNTGVTLDAYTIIPGENVINVYYKGIKAAEPIKVTGIADYATSILMATYKGSLTVGYAPTAADIELQAIMASGKIVNTATDKNMIPYITITEKLLESTTTELTVNFKTATYVIPIKVDATIPTTTIPTPSAVVATPTPTATIPVSTGTGPAIETATPIPTITVTTAPSTQTATPIPQETTPSVPDASNADKDEPFVMETTETEQAPVKGATYTI